MAGTPQKKCDSPRVININFSKLADTVIQGPYDEPDGFRIEIKPPGVGRPRTLRYPREKPATQLRDALVAAQKIMRDGSPVSLEDQEFEPTPDGYRSAIGRASKALIENPTDRYLQGKIRSLCEASKADLQLRDLGGMLKDLDATDESISEMQSEMIKLRTENQKLRLLHGKDIGGEGEVGEVLGVDVN